MDTLDLHLQLSRLLNFLYTALLHSAPGRMNLLSYSAVNLLL